MSQKAPRNYRSRSTSIHHRKPRSLGGRSIPRNLSELTVTKHTAWHVLFQNFTPERIAYEISERYLDPDYRMIAVKYEKPK